MNFGAGMGAGMGVGMGSGIAVGVATGRQRTIEQIREYISTNGLTINDPSGQEVDIEEFLSHAASDRLSEGAGRRILLIVLVLLGVAALSLLSYVAFFQ